MTKQSLSHDVLEGALMFEDILGKDIYDQMGAYVGVTNNVYISPENMELLALAVDKGFVSKGMVLGTGYIREVRKHAIFLNTRPVINLKGMAVYDKAGEMLGKVKEVELMDGRNEIASLLVKKMFRAYTVPADAIKSVEDSVFLKVRKEEL